MASDSFVDLTKKPVTKHLVIVADSPMEFQRKLDEASATHDVFATQTHVTDIWDDGIEYTAIVFYKERP